MLCKLSLAKLTGPFRAQPVMIPHAKLPFAGSLAMMFSIRPLRHDDLQNVASCYEETFRSGKRAAVPGLVDAFRAQFLDAPSYCPEIPSLVAESESGIVGFQGIQVREILVDGQEKRLASLGPMFIVPEQQGTMLAAKLMQRVLEGQQDLTTSDGASMAMLRLASHFGGVWALPQSMKWVLPLAPGEYLARSASGRYDGWRKVAGRSAVPVAKLLDKAISRKWLRQVYEQAVRVPERELLHPEALCGIAGFVSKSNALCPVYRPDIAKWLFEALAQWTVRGELVARELRSKGKPIGSFLAYAGPDKTLSLIQLLIRREHVQRGIAALIQEGIERNMSAITGRLEPHLASALLNYRAFYTNDTHVMHHSRSTELLGRIVSGDCLLTRAEGEWVLDLARQPFE